MLVQKYTDAMIDLETLGNNPEATILTAGLVFFNRTKDIDPTGFEFVISPEHLSGKMDYSTVLWWMEQSQEARSALLRKLSSPMSNTELHVCEKIQEVFYDHSDPATIKVWGNGANFDITILESMFRRNSRNFPWRFYNVRCYRTVKQINLEILPEEFKGIKHDALHDAYHQVEHLVRIFNSLSK